MPEWVAPNLPLIWSGIIVVGVIMYVLLDGFDLGVGILFQGAPSDSDRDIMMNSVAPIWDGNETWLVLGGAALFGAFPLAYAVILPGTYLPLLIMLIALIFRGVAFEFRFKSTTSRKWWDRAFHYGSLLATIAQGLVLGAFIQGFDVEDRTFVGSMLDWLTPFAVLTAVALVFGYALLGATWIIWRTEGHIQAWAYGIARPLLVGVLVFIGIVSIWTPVMNPTIAERWFAWPDMLWLSPVPVATALLAWLNWRALGRGYEVWPFFLSIGLFLLSFLGLGISLFPYVIPPSITIWEAASPPESQLFILVGVGALLPVILAYTFVSYWVFRGKVREGEGYEH
jgi:cytochrome d ubiquinol oxidase subunit II